MQYSACQLPDGSVWPVKAINESPLADDSNKRIDWYFPLIYSLTDPGRFSYYLTQELAFLS
jgi:hypothetical protein